MPNHYLYHIYADGEDYILSHSGVKGMKHGERRYQNKDGSLTDEGRAHYGIGPARQKKPAVKEAVKKAGNKTGKAVGKAAKTAGRMVAKAASASGKQLKEIGGNALLHTVPKAFLSKQQLQKRIDRETMITKYNDAVRANSFGRRLLQQGKRSALSGLNRMVENGMQKMGEGIGTELGKKYSHNMEQKRKDSENRRQITRENAVERAKRDRRDAEAARARRQADADAMAAARRERTVENYRRSPIQDTPSTSNHSSSYRPPAGTSAVRTQGLTSSAKRKVNYRRRSR